MPLYEIVKADGKSDKVYACYAAIKDGCLCLCNDPEFPIVFYAPGTWLEVWRREGVGE